MMPVRCPICGALVADTHIVRHQNRHTLRDIIRAWLRRRIRRTT